MRVLNGAKYSRIDQVKLFKDCLPESLLGPFLKTLSQICFWLIYELDAQQWLFIKYSIPGRNKEFCVAGEALGFNEHFMYNIQKKDSTCENLSVSFARYS